MTRNQEMLMGGVFAGAWGSMAGRSCSPWPPGCDRFGRWATALLIGKMERRILLVSCYRPPPGNRETQGLVWREIRSRGWQDKPQAAAAVRDAFYEDLGMLIREAQARRWEVIAGGDFNTSREDKVFNTWLGDLGLEPLGEESETDVPTFVHRRPGSREVRGSTLDHVFATPVARQVWGGGNPAPLEIVAVAAHPLGHRLLRVAGSNSVLPWLSLELTGRRWRRRKAALRRAAHRRRPPPRIDKEREDEYADELGRAADLEKLDAILTTLTNISLWGYNLWRGRKSNSITPLYVAGIGGGVVGRAELPAGVRARDEIPVGFTSAEGDEREFRGFNTMAVLQFAENLLTEGEAVVAKAMLASAWSLGKQGGEAQHLSRRKMDGWFPNIGEKRRVVVRLNKVMRLIMHNHWSRGREMIARWSRAGVWPGPRAPEVDSPDGWDQWLAECTRARHEAKGVLHAAKRRAKRAEISEAVAKREAAFTDGNIKRTLNSVLGRVRGAPLNAVGAGDGSLVTNPEEVKRRAADHFAACFDGAGTVPWYEETDQPERIRSVYQDTAAGRAHREELLEGNIRAEWHTVVGTDRSISTMLERKQLPAPEGEEGGGARVVREEWYDGILDEITLEEWNRYWREKTSFTSAGRSGIRPDMIKAAPELIQVRLIEMYNACLRLKTVPDQWRRSTVVPIPKKPGAVELGDLRPLKLLEVTRKAVLGIVKNRLRDVFEEQNVLHPAQHGFRQGRQTATAALTLLNLVEEARFLTRDIHVLCLDIRKAYDTVIRAIGTEGALRRLGVPLPVVELLMEVERRNSNDVRTEYDPILDPLAFMFPAERGFVQGSAISPLLWIVFYDMVICELDGRRVGSSATADTGVGNGGGGGADHLR